MTRRPLAAAATLACVLTLTACNEKSAAPSATLPSLPAEVTQPPDTTTEQPEVPVAEDIPVRLVLLPEGPGAVLEIKPPNQNLTRIGSDAPQPPGEGYEKEADLKLGEASDYLDMKAGSEVTMSGTTLVKLAATKPGQRQTIVIGSDANAKLYATGFVEQNGKVVSTFGRVKGRAEQPEPGKAVVFASAIGSAKSTKDTPFKLGVVGQGCLSDKAATDKEFTVVQAAPGDVDLAWFADEDCQQPAGDPESVSITEGQQAYAFAWAEGKGQPKVLFLPIES